MASNILNIMRLSPVIPVLVIDDLAAAVPLARALCAGGLSVLEVTLRTPIGLQAIERIAAEVPEAIVGAGTVLNPRDLDAALEVGSQFIVSPGATAALVDAALDRRAALLPGINTPSEAMALLDKGLTEMKFFPAEAAGGAAMLKAIAGPLPQIQFCPTGGIGLHNASDYLRLNNVSCVGGSWIATSALVAACRWDEISENARGAVRLGENSGQPAG